MYSDQNRELTLSKVLSNRMCSIPRPLRLALFLALALFFIGCNIFSPFHTAGDSSNVGDHLSDAKEEFAEQDYVKAMQLMNQALRIAPYDVRVRYFQAAGIFSSRLGGDGAFRPKGRHKRRLSEEVTLPAPNNINHAKICRFDMESPPARTMDSDVGTGDQSLTTWGV